MYRVILNILKVGLRIKQNIEVQLAIKKQNQTIMIAEKGRLDKCIAQFDAQSQFFITANDPSFSIYVMIVHGNGRKLAGTFHVNLTKYMENSNNQIHDKLDQSPDSQSYIIFEFIYMTTAYVNPNKQIVSVSQLEQNCQNELAKEIQQRNEYLDKQNTRLDLQLQDLRKDNLSLTHNKSEMNDYYEKNLFSYQVKVDKKTEEVQISQYNMAMMKQKIEKYGNQNVKDRIQQVLKKQ